MLHAMDSRSLLALCGAAAAAAAVLIYRARLKNSAPVWHTALQESHVMCKQLTTPAESAEWVALVMKLKDSGALKKNPMGADRFGGKYDCWPELQDAIAKLGYADRFEELTQRLEKRLGLSDMKRDPSLGRVFSCLGEGAFVHRHVDPYEGTELAMLRANLAISFPNPSASPIISDEVIPVAEGDAWAFIPSHQPHESKPLEGTQYRIVIGFGWAIPMAEMLKVPNRMVALDGSVDLSGTSIDYNDNPTF